MKRSRRSAIAERGEKLVVEAKLDVDRSSRPGSMGTSTPVSPHVTNSQHLAGIGKRTAKPARG